MHPKEVLGAGSRVEPSTSLSILSTVDAAMCILVFVPELKAIMEGTFFNQS